MSIESLEFGKSVRAAIERIAPTDRWVPGTHDSDETPALTKALDEIGWLDVCESGSEALPFVAAGAFELGRSATSFYDVARILGGAPIVDGLALYGHVDHACPGHGRIVDIVERTAVPYTDSLGVYLVEVTESDAVESSDERVQAFEAATVAYMAGMADKMMEDALDHARTREVFGATLAHVDAVQQRLADAATVAEALRIQALDGAPGHAQLAHAAARTSDVMEHAHAIFGGIGFTLEFPLQRYSRRAKALGVFIQCWLKSQLPEQAA